MPISLHDKAQEGSTYVVHAAFYDEDGAAVVPTSVKWSLFDVDEAIVNSRTDVNVTPAAEVDIVLAGADLLLTDGPFRNLVIECTYDSTLGVGLPLVAEANFHIHDVAGVP